MAVGTYRRLEEIGRGSFATVYKASSSVSRRPGATPHRRHDLSLVQHLILLDYVYAFTNAVAIRSYVEVMLMTLTYDRNHPATLPSNRSICTSSTES